MSMMGASIIGSSVLFSMIELFFLIWLIGYKDLPANPGSYSVLPITLFSNSYKGFSKSDNIDALFFSI